MELFNDSDDVNGTASHTGDNEDIPFSQLWHTQARLNMVIVCLCFSFIGNGLTLFVLIKTSIKHTPTGVCLMVISVIDSLILLTELLVRVPTVDTSDYICAVTYYVRYSLKLADNFIMVTLCAYRTATLAYPFYRGRLTKANTVRVLVAMETLISFVLCIYALFTMRLYDIYGCNVDPGHQFAYLLSDTIISVLIGEIICGIAIIVMSVLIIKALISMRENSARRHNKEQSRSTLDKQVTRMTLTLAVTFLILKLPYTTLWAVDFIKYVLLKAPTDEYRYTLYVMTNLAAILSYLNYCTNFLIYVSCWTAFRTKLLTCQRKKRKAANNVSVRGTGSTSA